MAEDEVSVVEDDEFVNIEEGRPSSQRRKVYGGYVNRQCNSRLEELAKPRKWTMLATWRDHRNTFDEARMQMLKEKIQEEFSMTPEETEVYFNQLRNRARRIINKRALAKQIKRDKAMAKHEAYRIFKKLLKKSMKFAFLNPPPPIVSPALREISNKLLAELCRIHCVCVPKRNNTDKKSIFLLNLADWAAILISNIYYELDVHETTESNRILEAMSKVSVDSSEGKASSSDKDDKDSDEETTVGEEEDTDGNDDGNTPENVAATTVEQGHLKPVIETEEESDSPVGARPQGDDEPETETGVFEYE